MDIQAAARDRLRGNMQLNKRPEALTGTSNALSKMPEQARALGVRTQDRIPPVRTPKSGMQVKNMDQAALSAAAKRRLALRDSRREERREVSRTENQAARKA